MKKISKSSKIILVSCIIVIFCVVAVGSAAAIVLTKNDTTEEKTYEKTVVHSGDLRMNFTGDGTTQISTTAQTMSLDTSVGDIEVKEVSVSSGDTVAKGDTVLKVSESDVKAANKYYKKAVAEAANTLKKTQLEYDVAMLEAEYTKEISNSNASLASTTLNASVDELDDAVDDALSLYDDAKMQIQTITQNLKNDKYYSDNKVGTTLTAYNNAKKSLEESKEAYTKAKKNQSQVTSYKNKVTECETEIKSSIESYNSTLLSMYKLLGLDTENFVGVTYNPTTKTTTESETTSANTANNNPAGAGTKLKSSMSSDTLTELTTLVTKLNKLEGERKTYQNNIDTNQEKADKLQSQIDTAKQNYEQAKQKVTKTKNEYTQAKQNYNNAINSANQNLKQLKENLPQLQVSYEQAVRDKVTKTVSLNNDYSQTSLSGESADTIYKNTITSWKQTLNTAKNNLKTLKAQQKVINNIKDGKVKASQSGTIASVGYESGDTLSSSTALVNYYKTDVISISVEVDQSNIASLKVGDEVSVAISNNRGGNLTGKVATIATAATTSGSNSKVTYAVGIEVDNSSKMLSSGSSATVTFTGDTKKDVTYISSKAVTTVKNTTVVYMYDDNEKVKKVPVSIGNTTDEYTEITSGLKQGDICLIEQNSDENAGGKN